MNPKYQPIWERAKPYLTTRSNDKHTLYCYYFAEQLLKVHPEADESIVLPAILLHDVGWSAVPEDKQLQSFGPNMIYPELRRLHETEGARIAGEILCELQFEAAKIVEITQLIDGHDTRKEALSLNDSLLRDADKMWVYTQFGLETVSAWFGYSHDEQMELLEKWLEYRFYTDAGQHMARGLFAYLQILNQQLVGTANGMSED